LRKFLVIRFSSIGDIVLTTPIVRALKEQLNAEVHFVTKAVFVPLLQGNPHISKIFTIDAGLKELSVQLKSENYEAVIDLHKNMRSLRLRSLLGLPVFTFDKLNLAKFMVVNFKKFSMLPPLHIVERYFNGLKKVGVMNDNKGLDFFIPPSEEINVASIFSDPVSRPFLALVVGGSYYTKKIPLNKLSEICGLSPLPVVLLGGKEDSGIAHQLKKDHPTIIDLTGKLSVNGSASVVRQATWVITSDTGLMHIATAFQKRIISVWGNTIPEFGMFPYLSHPESMILEVEGLGCRPCSKLGYSRCPLGHFKCMNEIDYSFVKDLQ
jgi:ADP-heptose:LPS heptosyltransferase